MASPTLAAALTVAVALAVGASAAPLAVRSGDGVLVSTRTHGTETSPASAHATAALATLQSRFYDEGTGGWGCVPAMQRGAHGHGTGGAGAGSGMSVGWWNCANALTAVSDYVTYGGQNASTYTSQIENSWAKTAEVYKVMVAVDGSNDDQGWWALAWIRASMATGNPSYVSRSEGYFQHVAQYWDSTCNGGVWWSSKKGYKNAITNELFLMTSARLYQLTGNATYLGWAQREWAWFNASGMIDDRYLINDGLTSECANNGGTTWTYNQGVILGGLVHLWQAEAHEGGQPLDPNSPYLHLIARLANATTTLLVDSNGVLVEPCEGSGGSDPCGSDGPQFKGIFVRYLGYAMAQVQRSLPQLPSWWTPYHAKFAAFLQTNAAAAWSRDQSGGAVFGLHWDGPSGVQESPQCQTAALDLFNAASLPL